VVEATAACEKAFREALLDNFNTPGAVASLSLLVSECLPSFEAMPAASLEPLRGAAAFIEKSLGQLGVEGLTVVPPNEEQWVSAVNAFATLRMEVRVLAKEKAAADKLAEVVAKAEKAAKDVKGNGAKVAVEKLGAFCTAIRAVVKKAGKGTPPAAELMGLCDEVRDKTMVEMGIRLEDGGATGFLWMFEDKEILRKELQEQAEKAAEAAREKLANKLNQKRTELKVAEKSSVPPEELFKSQGLYSEFDGEGMPTKLVSGEELSAKKKKDLVKELTKHKTDHAKLQKQAGEAGIAAWVEKLTKEVREMEAKLH
jgi:cysteinyl-tRNA synthetase